jgi:hypothetical protein
MMMEVINSSETLVHIQTTRLYITDDGTLSFIPISFAILQLQLIQFDTLAAVNELNSLKLINHRMQQCFLVPIFIVHLHYMFRPLIGGHLQVICDKIYSKVATVYVNGSVE